MDYSIETNCVQAGYAPKAANRASCRLPGTTYKSTDEPDGQLFDMEADGLTADHKPD